MPPNQYTRQQRPVVIPPGPSTAYVELTQGQHSLIDREMASFFEENNWCANWARGTRTYYAESRRLCLVTKRKVRRSIHQVVLGEPGQGLVCDHINGNTLDNRRCNLRLATKSQNAMNSCPRVTSASGFRNVYRRESRGVWEASIKVNGKAKYLGSFRSSDQANAAVLKEIMANPRFYERNLRDRLDAIREI